MIRAQMEINEFVFPHLGHGLRKMLESKNMSQLLNPYGITIFLYHPFEGSIVNGFVRAIAKGNLVLIVSSREKEDDNPVPAPRHLLGHTISGDVSGTLSIFKQ